MIDTQKVKIRMLELDLTNESIAESLNLSLSGWYQKLNGNRAITISELFELQKILKLDDTELKDFF
ncbi:hypothetical protein ACKA04_04650 [Helcococcus kunzii]|uniref:hypothetical protein n=1 Tax=Helcococcus kunzii TaxID=40091 RepID=UPI0038B162E5